ncbi:hypothetical protein PsYK624_140190 [Phanerochaete sordida]|uniref:Uncharacterized protein n=1 Tax=Phanerochaete sordida TaxID=48140 RepID=A0A9P3LJV2_9APHY|nr:hypothetical protein PsYK624_140190 [Phanerochaete sordida]
MAQIQFQADHIPEPCRLPSGAPFSPSVPKRARQQRCAHRLRLRTPCHSASVTQARTAPRLHARVPSRR